MSGRHAHEARRIRGAKCDHALSLWLLVRRLLPREERAGRSALVDADRCRLLPEGPVFAASAA